ncbi:hypothetical protein AB0F18_33910 [Streptomyces sp. NPDC029216]|uniref:hypothetical protein n=1 Tax=Streptomyces sp. NPDC029216 TaxID=3154701 RepID=UPI0033F58A1D
MESLSYRHGEDARHGGVDITISLTPAEAKALGGEEGLLADWFDTALWALSMFRTGSNPRGPVELDPAAAEITPDTLYRVINDLDNRLLPRLQGIRDMAIRRHHELGGSIGDLALAMDVVKSTAQSRRNVVISGKDRPSMWENWAVKGGPQNREFCAACGHPAFPTDPIVTTDDDDRYRIHQSHTQNPKDGFYGTPIVDPDDESFVWEHGDMHRPDES